MRLPALLLSVGLASTTAAQTVEDQIRTEVGRYVLAINRGDAQAVAALYLNDLNASSIGDGRIYRGWHTIADVFREVYSRVGTIQMTVDSVGVVPLGTNTAAAIMRYRWVLGGEKAEPATGAMTLLYVRTPEGWRVAHDHTSTLGTDAAVTPRAAELTDSGPRLAVRQTLGCTITRVVDGDTIECTRLGRIRLIGIDTPELNQPPFGHQAASVLAGLIPPGTEVQVEQDVEARDRYGRLLAYIWLDGILVNWRLIREGWAVLLTYPPNVQFVDWFTDAERRARDEDRGLWASGGFNCRPVDRRRGRCD